MIKLEKCFKQTFMTLLVISKESIVFVTSKCMSSTLGTTAFLINTFVIILSTLIRKMHDLIVIFITKDCYKSIGKLHSFL